MTDPARVAQRITTANGHRRLSTVDGPFRPGGDRAARPVGPPGRWPDPMAARRLTDPMAARRYPDPTGARRLAEPPTSRPLAVAPALTARERAVLTLLAEGYATREIAKRLSYSERTIKNILQDFTSRLHLRNRTQAVAYALRRGWI